MASSSTRQRQNHSIWRSQSNPETTLNPTLKHDPETSGPRTIEQSVRWCHPIPEHCCIYRVPQSLRRANPEAYTPQLVIIGPLHLYLKYQPLDITNTKLMGYLNMEEHKKVYLEDLAQRCDGIIPLLQAKIKEDEEKIRASYSESTSWIKSTEFVDMILLDSVFIVEFLLKSVPHYQESRTEKTGDIVLDEPCLELTIYADLILLENQLPYFILNGIFELIYGSAEPREWTLRKLILTYFGFQGKIKEDSDFKHFTDLLRCVRVETLGSEDSKNPTKTKFRSLEESRVETEESRESKKNKLKQCIDLFRCKEDKLGSRKSSNDRRIKHMYNAEKLYSGGVDFVAMENGLSVDVRFKNGCLKLPCLWIHEDWEIIIRNIMALEQCHYPLNAYVCNYITFLDFLIDSVKDVDLLTEKGIIHNWIGEQSLVAKMVNKLSLGVVEVDSYLFDVASEVKTYYDSPINRSRYALGRTYFSNVWTGTATIAAMLLLFLTLIQAVMSIIQVIQNTK